MNFSTPGKHPQLWRLVAMLVIVIVAVAILFQRTAQGPFLAAAILLANWIVGELKLAPGTSPAYEVDDSDDDYA